MPPNPASDALARPRTRSFGFLEHDGTSWACYLVSYRTAQNRWCGYLTFRPDGADPLAAVRTADLFIESNEAEIAQRARGLGRPLLTGLLASALDVDRRPSGEKLRGWVRDALDREQTRGTPPPPTSSNEVDAGALRAAYATYRLDQLTHLVSLVDHEHFQSLVAELLAEEPYSFRSQDRLQFAMLFVQKLEPLVPLPPFEVFAEDYRAHRAAHERYHHDLHAGQGVDGP